MINQHLSRRHFIEKAALASAGLAFLSSARTSHWQIGCYTRPWAEFDYRVAFDGMTGAGFRYAGLMTCKSGLVISTETTPDQVAQVKKEADARGLKIASLYGGNFDVTKSVDEGIAGFKKLIDYAALCDCPNLLLAGIAEPELVDNYYKVVTECCDYAAGKRVGISVKPHGPLNSTGLECRPLIEKVGHKSFRLWYDPGNIYYYSDGKLNPVDDAADVDGLVVGMSVKDFRMPKDVNVTPGTGLVDFPGVMARLRQGGFKQGPLIVECLAVGDVSFINAEARKACLFLEELTAAI